MRLLSLFVFLTFYYGCAVEVGNPNGDKSTGTGTVKVNIATENQGEGGFSLRGPGKRFDLYIDSVELRGYNEDENISTVLKLTTDSVNLFSGDSLIELAQDQAVVGTYETIVVVLKEKNPFRYLPDGQNEAVVAFEKEEYRSFYLSETFNLEEGSLEEILIDLDLSSSLVPEKDRFIFKPHFGAFRKHHFFERSGKVDFENGKVVCAYLFEPVKRKHKPRGFNSDRPDHFKLPPPPPGIDGKRFPYFEKESDIVFDEVDHCPNAFKSTSVLDDKSYTFDRLKPGKYKLRVFLNDGKFKDLDDVLTVEPPMIQHLRKHRWRHGWD